MIVGQLSVRNSRSALLSPDLDLEPILASSIFVVGTVPSNQPTESKLRPIRKPMYNQKTRQKIKGAGSVIVLTVAPGGEFG
jgi:hypothetical protein